MEALVVQRPGDVAVREWDEPAVGPTDLLIAVAACGVCGTDRHIVAGTYPAVLPNVLGHELAGTIVQAGPDVRQFAVGEEVAVDPNIPDHLCAACRRGDIHLCEHLQAVGVTRPGGMAPHVVVPQTQAYRVPSGLSLEEAAFAEPLSCIVHGLDRTRIAAGSSVVILGAGSIGLLMQQAVRSYGAASVVVSEPSPVRRNISEELGADEVYTPEMLEHESHSDAYDVVIDCTGNANVAVGTVRLARRGGEILLFGVAAQGQRAAFEPYELYRKELRIIASNINPFTMDKALSMMASGTVKVDKIVSQRVGLKDLPRLLTSKPAADEIKVALQLTP